jgi:hypothetical protein
MARRDRDAEAGEQLLGLIFVNVHGAALKQIGAAKERQGPSSGSGQA